MIHPLGLTRFGRMVILIRLSVIKHWYCYWWCCCGCWWVVRRVLYLSRFESELVRQWVVVRIQLIVSQGVVLDKSTWHMRTEMSWTLSWIDVFLMIRRVVRIDLVVQVWRRRGKERRVVQWWHITICIVVIVRRVHIRWMWSRGFIQMIVGQRSEMFLSRSVAHCWLHIAIKVRCLWRIEQIGVCGIAWRIRRDRVDQGNIGLGCGILSFMFQKNHLAVLVDFFMFFLKWTLGFAHIALFAFVLILVRFVFILQTRIKTFLIVRWRAFHSVAQRWLFTRQAIVCLQDFELFAISALFFVFHASILKPNFDLTFGQIEIVGNFHSSRSTQVFVRIELFLQLD